MIRVVIGDDSSAAKVCKQVDKLIVHGVIYKPDEIAELGGVVLCSNPSELQWLVRADYSPRLIKGLR